MWRLTVILEGGKWWVVMCGGLCREKEIFGGDEAYLWMERLVCEEMCARC